MPLPDLNLLLALDVLIDECSVAAAARRMNLSAPAMSRTLGRIRTAPGDPVLVRAGRGLAPTPRALQLREQVRDVIEQAHRVFNAGREIDLRTLERTFNVRANDVFIGGFGGRLRELFRQQAPRAKIIPCSMRRSAPSVLPPATTSRCRAAACRVVRSMMIWPRWACSGGWR